MRRFQFACTDGRAFFARWPFFLIPLCLFPVHVSPLASGGATYPVVSCIISDCVMRGVEQNGLKGFRRRILGHPVGVQESQISALSSNSFVRDSSEKTSLGLCVDTLMDWLSVHNTLGEHLLASSTANGNSPDRKALRALKSKFTGLVWTRRKSTLVHGRKLRVLPSAHSQDKAHHIRLLALPDLFEVFISSHYLY